MRRGKKITLYEKENKKIKDKKKKTCQLVQNMTFFFVFRNKKRTLC